MGAQESSISMTTKVFLTAVAFVAQGSHGWAQWCSIQHCARIVTGLHLRRGTFPRHGIHRRNATSASPFSRPGRSTMGAKCHSRTNIVFESFGVRRWRRRLVRLP